MILKNAYLSICLLWNHAIATKLTQTQALGLKSEALAAPVCFMLSIWPLPCHSSAGSLCPARRHTQQPNHQPVQTLSTLLQWGKKYCHGLGCDSWETPYPPCHPCQGQKTPGGHRHLKIAAAKTPELEVHPHGGSSKRQNPARGKCPTFQKDDGAPMTDDTEVSSSKLAR